MNYGEFGAELARQFAADRPVRLRLSLPLAEQLIAEADGTLVVELVEVKPDWREPEHMTLVLTSAPRLELAGWESQHSAAPSQ